MVGKKQTRRPAGAEDFIEVSGVVRTETVVQAGLITADCRVAAYLNGDWYTLERLRNFLEDLKSASPNTLVTAIAEDVKKFKGAAQQADDITMICLQYQG
jgi:hypothetical protein